MLRVSLIGNVGADAEKKSGNGYEFYSFRVAHNERFTDAQGKLQTRSMWIDCNLSKDSKVAEYLKAGTQVFIQGTCSLRVYSSEKDRCMKAGLTVHVQNIELLSAKPDPVPRRLIDSNGAIHDVVKYYHTDVQGGILNSERGQQFAVDDNGWVVPLSQVPTDVDEQAQQEEASERPAEESAEETSKQKTTTKKK